MTESISRFAVVREISELTMSCLVGRDALAQRGEPREEYQVLGGQILILMQLADELELYEELNRTVAIPQDLKDQYEGLPPR